MSDIDDSKFGRCTCGAALIPIWDDWWDDNKHINFVVLNVYLIPLLRLILILFWKLVNQDKAQ